MGRWTEIVISDIYYSNNHDICVTGEIRPSAMYCQRQQPD